MAAFPLSILENLNQTTETFFVLATNSTSGNKISKKPGDVELISLAQSGVTLEVPRRSCSHGHSFILQIEAVIPVANDKPIKLQTQVTGVVEAIEGDIQQDRFQVRLEFRQYSIEEWQRFLKHVENRQANVNHHLKEMKK